MKKIIIVVALITVGFVNAQAYKGKGDKKFQIGANFQDGGIGIQSSIDFGLGENISLGIVGLYILGGSEIDEVDTEDRIDFRARFNANIGNVINLDPNFDLYPGLSLGLKNFGGHIGARYLFSKGFGVFTEVAFPIAKYDTNSSIDYNNQTTLCIGACFDI
jgi:hypothetical protein